MMQLGNLVQHAFHILYLPSALQLETHQLLPFEISLKKPLCHKTYISNHLFQKYF